MAQVPLGNATRDRGVPETVAATDAEVGAEARVEAGAEVGAEVASGARLQGSMRALIAHPYGGTLAMTGFPGLETAVDGTAVFLPDTCHDTLAGLRSAGAQSLVVLVERDELDPAGFTLLERVAAELDLAVQYHPIADYDVPDAALMQAWTAQRAARAAHLRGGGTLAFACQYGAGRSGLMACWSLMEAGLSAAQSMETVRGQFAEAVESEAQEAWLRHLQIAPE